MTPEERALANVSACDDLALLRKILNNARGKSERVEKAAFSKIIRLSAKDENDPVARDCWEMIHAVEELRRLERGKRVPMRRLRDKIARDGEKISLEYLALHRSDGFQEVIDYGFPELLAEKIVVKHGAPTFSEAAVKAAEKRLNDAGIA